MIAVHDREVAKRLRTLRQHAMDLSDLARHGAKDIVFEGYPERGWNCRMTDLQAALGLHQLPHLDEWIDVRAAQWDRYDALLRDLPLETPAPPQEGTRHARHLYTILVRPDAPRTRDEVLSFLNDRRIGTGVHYRGVHLHPYYRDEFGIRAEDLPVATDISERTLSLPFGPKVTEADQDDVVAALADALGG